jgi:YegS/Rv2252/BmrU family lipid kinase
MMHLGSSFLASLIVGVVLMREAKVIVNPIAAGGKVGRRWPQLRDVLAKGGLPFDAELTQHPGHATVIAQRAVDDGYRHIVSVGGDGTVNEVVNGLVVDGQVPSDLVLSIVPGGTGCDFVRILDIARDPVQACQTVLGDRVRTVDLGEIRCLCQGKSIVRYFVNVAGVGFDGETSVRVNRMSKRITGTLPYLTSLLLTLVSYQNKDVELTVNEYRLLGRLNSVVICNGQYFGGGMWVGPQAAADDGVFDVVLLKDLTKPELIVNIPRIYRGTHLTHPKVESLQGTEIHVKAQQRMFIQAEGELVGETPASFRMLPAALNLRA